MNNESRDEQLRDLMREPSLQTSAAHDAAIRDAARACAADARLRRPASRRGAWLMGLAASFLVGVALTALVQQSLQQRTRAEVTALTMPASSIVRGSSGATTMPVETVDPAQWYVYIQELLYEGDREAALRHLQRFNELHPDYVHRP
jgi:hypothetical protein